MFGLPRKQCVVLNVDALTLAARRSPPVLRAGHCARNTQTSDLGGRGRSVKLAAGERLVAAQNRTFLCRSWSAKNDPLLTFAQNVGPPWPPLGDATDKVEKKL